MFYHDMSNDYREREFKITITLQEGYYKAEIYDEYYTGGAMGHGLHMNTINNIYHYLKNLVYIENDDWEDLEGNCNGGFELHNNCHFVIDKDNRHVHFIMRNDEGNILEKTISKFDIEKYIVGIAITSCTGRGVKRDSRKCAICKNFERIEGRASGMCLEKKRKVSQGTTICKYGFIENKDV